MRREICIERGHVIPARLPQDKHLKPQALQTVRLGAISGAEPSLHRRARRENHRFVALYQEDNRE